MMKTKIVGLFMLCLLFTGISLKMSAQTHLDALIAKCETSKSVDMEMVKTNHRTDKEIETKSVNIRIKDDKKLVNDFLEAFKKDASKAEQVMFKKKRESNEINYYQCRFPEQIYTIVVKEEGNASVTVGNHYSGQFSTESLRLEQQKHRIEQQKERIERQKQRIEQQKERQKKQIEQQKHRVEHQKERIEWQKKRVEQQKERIERQKKRIEQYKLKNLDSILIKHNIIADSLVLQSITHLKAINWDSIASKFGKDIDSMVNKLGIGWDSVLVKYEFE